MWWKVQPGYMHGSTQVGYVLNLADMSLSMKFLMPLSSNFTSADEYAKNSTSWYNQIKTIKNLPKLNFQMDWIEKAIFNKMFQLR